MKSPFRSIDGATRLLDAVLIMIAALIGAIGVWFMFDLLEYPALIRLAGAILGALVAAAITWLTLRLISMLGG